MKTIYILIIYIFLSILFSCSSGELNNELLSTSIKNQKKNITAEETLKEFIYQLGNQNFNEAYKMTSNSNWKNFDEFSSQEHFGSICGTTINSIRINSVTDSTAQIYTEVFYKDETNGDKILNQIFYLKKDKKVWKITEIKNLK